MFRDHSSIDVTDLESTSVEMLWQVLLKLEKEIISVKLHVNTESSKVSNERQDRIESGKSVPAVYDTIQNFCQQLTADLTHIQAVCSEYKINGLLDIARETKLRQKPASYKAYIKDLKKLSGSCILPDEDDEPNNIYTSCNCHWSNVPENKLEPTQDIIKRPIQPRKTAFDSTDLKFKQELTVLRTKLFTLPEVIPKRRKVSGFDQSASLVAETKAANEKAVFTEPIDESTAYNIIVSVKEETAKIGSLKFIDGKFTHCELWRKLLDANGNQLRSKWLLVLCPQMEAILKKRIVPSAFCSADKVFDLLSDIKENGATYSLSKEDMLNVLKSDSEAAEFFKGWKATFKQLSGIQLAALTIQRYWKGYAVRKDIRESNCKYIAASIIWMAWLFLKKKRYMHEQYLTQMLMMSNSTEKLNAKMSLRYSQIVGAPHVVIHLPSLGHPVDIRSAVSPPIFRIYQNILALKISFLRNPNAEVVYILPIEPSESLLRMYYDILESVHPGEGIQKRVTFLALSMRSAFTKCSFNTARTLYYSDDTLAAINAKVSNKPAYILPWVMDECDVWAAGTLKVPWVGPSFNFQLRLLNKSNNADMLSSFGIEQPPYTPHVKDYSTLCTELAELICQHTEVCLWLIKLNVGIDGNQTGVFLINNVSVPFMPQLRKARETSGDEWKPTLQLRRTYLNRLNEQLPEIVYTTTRLASNYKSWKDFYLSLTKHGCLLQAVPNQKNASIISAAIFIPARETKEKPVWTGTVDQMHLETQFTAFGFMMPQTSFPNEYVRTTVTEVAEVLQNMGYFGYVSFDLFCYVRRSDDLPIALVVDLDAYYSKVHNFLDWFCFTINGRYDAERNSFSSDVELSVEARKKFYHPASKTVRWNETIERFGIAMGRLHHTQLYRRQWPKLYYFTKKCEVRLP
ncbi:IQ motif-containing protein H-like [Athalia rosae]|uniref:IQ motif-containing protein H-like n=1 Tax=Athalia rosae TaxID=37344 RepID=UPI0020336F56|nr:IQ motif-containing protein H-like [Athalia rosae]